MCPSFWVTTDGQQVDGKETTPRKKDKPLVAAALRTIFAQPDQYDLPARAPDARLLDQPARWKG
jgi:hypothetical protein